MEPACVDEEDFEREIRLQHEEEVRANMCRSHPVQPDQLEAWLKEPSVPYA